jgi:DNA recombination protein RmuC
LRPDIIINLPEGHHIIVDSKVTLVAYDAYVAANDEAEHEAARVAFVAAVKGHVNDLAGKAYQDNPKLKAPDFVFMFLPIEGALALALESDPQLFTYAWERRVAVVGPSMLMTSLRLVAGVWSIERREENAQRIAEEAAGLYEQVRLVLESVESLGTRIDQSQKAYDQVISRLTQGRGNLLRRVENFPKLGVAVKKQIPELAAAARPLENVIE